MKQSEFFSSLLPLARKAGEAFRINPVVILAQAAIESGWGQSDLASEHHNYFGLTADVSDDPKAFARKIAYSKYISEVNGDNRAAYQALLVKVCRKISKLIPHPINHNS